MHRPLDGIQAMSMGTLGPRGPPHHPHLPPSTSTGSSGAGAEGALRVSPHHPHHTPASHLSPGGSEGGPGVILSPHGHPPHLNHHHHHHHHDQQHLHPDHRLTQEMINFHHHQQQQQHHNNGNGSTSDLNCNVSTSSGAHMSGEGIANGPGTGHRQLSPSSRRSISPVDAERRRERKNGEIMDVDEDRRTDGGEDGDGRKSRERRQSMGSDYNRNGDIKSEDDGLHPHHLRNGPRRSSSRNGYLGGRSPEHGSGSLERSPSDQLHHPQQPQHQYHRSRSVSPDYRHHHHRHMDHRDQMLHPSHPLEEEHLRKMAGSSATSSYPCDSVMDLSMTKPPAMTSASPPSRSSSTASSSHVVDKEVAGVTTNSSSSNNNSSASATAMPPPKTPTSAVTTPTAPPNGPLGGVLGLGLAIDGRRRTASSSEFGESESEPGKRDVTTTSATPTNSGADSSIHHCQHCNIFFNDYTMFHLHESLHMPYEDHPFRCPSCGTHCQDKIEFMFHTVWHVKYPHTIPNYTPFREGFLAASSP